MIANILNWEVDFYGQRLAERLGQFLLVAGFISGTVVGFVMQSLQIAVIGWIIGVALTLIICIPPWPFYNRHPIKWRPAKFKKKAAKEVEEKLFDESPNSSETETSPLKGKSKHSGKKHN